MNLEQTTCIGFGETEGKCTRPAGCPHSPLWCVECNAARMAYIDRRLEELQKQFEKEEK